MIDLCDFPILLSFATTTPGITYSTPKTILTKGKEKSNHNLPVPPTSLYPLEKEKKLVSVELFLLAYCMFDTSPIFFAEYPSTPVGVWQAKSEPVQTGKQKTAVADPCPSLTSCHGTRQFINPNNQSANHQSINPSTHQTINQSVNPSIQSINPSIHQSINLSAYQPLTSQPTNPSIINQSINLLEYLQYQSINLSIYQSINPLVH